VVDTLQCFSRINFIGILYNSAKISIIGNHFTKEKEHAKSEERLANPEKEGGHAVYTVHFSPTSPTLE
jgi:hypothetical protein